MLTCASSNSFLPAGVLLVGMSHAVPYQILAVNALGLDRRVAFLVAEALEQLDQPGEVLSRENEIGRVMHEMLCVIAKRHVECRRHRFSVHELHGAGKARVVAVGVDDTDRGNGPFGNRVILFRAFQQIDSASDRS